LEQYGKNINIEDSHFVLSNLEMFFGDEDIFFINTWAIDLFKHFYVLHAEVADIENKKGLIQRDLRKHGIFKIESKLSMFFWGNFYLYHSDLANSRKVFLELTTINPNSPLGWGGLKMLKSKWETILTQSKTIKKQKN